MAYIDIDIECAECGNGLEADQRRGVIGVDPCETCMDKAREEARKTGYAEGSSDGYDRARSET